MAAAAGFLLGFPVLRLRGDYLAIVTLGFGEIVRILLLNNTEITGGPNGISQIPKPTLFGLEFSRTAREGGWDTFSNFFGLKYDPSDRVIFLYLVALREDEIACRSLGLSPRRIKLTAFTISAAFAGFAGTLFAARQALSALNPSLCRIGVCAGDSGARRYGLAICSDSGGCFAGGIARVDA